MEAFVAFGRFICRARIAAGAFLASLRLGGGVRSTCDIIKLENHFHALALYFMFYSFVRIHKTLKVTPAMAARVTDRLWSMEDIAAAIDARAEPPAKRGPYKKRAAESAA